MQNETDLPTAPSEAEEHTWIPGSDGFEDRAQSAFTEACPGSSEAHSERRTVGLRKRAILRGRGAFQRVFEGGRRLDGRLVGCIYAVGPATHGALRAGFVVSSRHLNAVRRNRVRRLLREAFRRSSLDLGRATETAVRSVEVLLVYRPRQRTETDRLTVHDVLPDVASACRTIATRLVSS
jgi:ribonuclease P protein component